MSLRYRNLKLASHFSGASVMKFAAGSSGDVPAAITIAGASTMIDLPSYLTLDHADNLYVSNDGGRRFSAHFRRHFDLRAGQ
jgi:hypothetical protein